MHDFVKLESRQLKAKFIWICIIVITNVKFDSLWILALYCEPWETLSLHFPYIFIQQKLVKRSTCTSTGGTRAIRSATTGSPSTGPAFKSLRTSCYCNSEYSGLYLEITNACLLNAPTTLSHVGT